MYTIIAGVQRLSAMKKLKYMFEMRGLKVPDLILTPTIRLYKNGIPVIMNVTCLFDETYTEHV